MKNRVSIVIPIYNEGERVRTLADNLDKVKHKYEVIFVDASKDEVAREILSGRYTYVESPKGRAIQMNLGYSMTTGEIVLFIHADSLLEEDCIEKVTNAVDSGVKFGCLFIQFDDRRLLMRICSYMSRWRAIHRKIAFGDQGLFFTRDFFEELGMYRELPIMEDYDISIRAKEITDLVQINSKIITSTRKYYTGYGIFNKGILSWIGIMKNMYDMQVYQAQFRKGVSTDKILQEYYKTNIDKN